ncbi:MAG: YraN family protein [Planctomyces sp.]|nr:YraN family protein [Planctomyces sp.]
MRIPNLFRRWLGNRGEAASAEFLESLGYRIIARQFRTIHGEVDLIALDGVTVVFIEVKTRSSQHKGQPFEAVNAVKQRKLTLAALVWLTQNRRLNQSVRFDVLSLIWTEGAAKPEIQHFRNAFEAVGFQQMYR